MKTAILIAAIVACALSPPIVSAQKKSAPAKPEHHEMMEKCMDMTQMMMEQMMQHDQMIESMPAI